MPTYRIEAETFGREVYLVDADSPEDAERQVRDGEHEPTVSEVLSIESLSTRIETD